MPPRPRPICQPHPTPPHYNTLRDTVIHGTTLVTNAVIERKGDRTALVTTRGFRDAVEIAREHRYDMYDLNLDLPLAPRHLRFEVDERIRADGSVHAPWTWPAST